MLSAEIPRNKMSPAGRAVALTAATGGVAVVGAYGFVELARLEPKAMLAMLANWGPLFAVAVVLALLGDRRIGELIAVNKDNAASQARMADAIVLIASKRDTEAEEQRTLMSYVGSQMESVLKRQEDILEQLRKRPL